ncbi:MAG TPA: universal stress protein [Actinomycetota bacterium]|nr:universal stress protein [Actinomycetota bacterium]
MADQMTADRPFSLVLAGVDGSERAVEAARQAARLASAAGAHLIVAYVIEEVRPYEEGDAERALEAAIAVARTTGADPEARVLTGDDAGDALVGEAERDGVDLLCVGPDSELLGGAIRFGHVAGRILRDATCSVLIARPAGPGFPRHIACAIDGSDASVLTALAAAGVARATGAELRLLHVVPVFRGRNEEWTLGPHDQSPPELEPSVKAVSSLGLEPIREMAMGRPERTLVHVAERDEVDLVVVGHRGVSGMTRRLLGSVSEHVGHHAPCSVFIVRPSGAARG